MSDTIHNSAILPRQVGGIVSIVNPDAVRFGGTVGIKVKISEAGFRLEATELRRLIIVEGSATGYGAIPIPLTESPVYEAIIPGDVWRVMFPKKMRERCHIRITLGEKRSFLTTHGMELNFANQEGKFPDLQSILPTNDPIATPGLVDAKLLSELLAIAYEVCGTDQGTTITMHKNAAAKWGEEESHLMRITANGGNGLSFLAVLVQLKPYQDGSKK